MASPWALLATLLILLGGWTILPAQDSADTTSADSSATERELTDREKAQALLVEIDAALDSTLALESQIRSAETEDREEMRVQGRRQFEIVSDRQPELLDLIAKLREAGEPVDSISRATRSILKKEMGLYDRAIRWFSDAIDDLRHQRTSTPPGQIGALESRVQEARERLDALLAGATRTLTQADSLGLSSSDGWEDLDRYLQERAETLVGRLQIAVQSRNRLSKQIRDLERAKTSDQEISALRAQYQSAQRRIKGIAKSLEETARLLRERGYETTGYRQFIIQATGEVTEDILDPRVLWGILVDLAKEVWSWFRDNAPALLVKLLILIGIVIFFRIGFRIAWWLMRLLGIIKRSKLMADMFGRLIRPMATLAGIFTGLWFLGADPTTLLTGVGVAGIIVGLALQDSLSNLAAGMFILATRPYDVDDIIMAGGVTGTVKAMGLANTTVLTFDNRRMLIPNRKIWGDNIENRSAEPIRRLDLVVRIGYNEDLERAMGILAELVKEDPRVLESPETHIFVWKLADSWIDIAVRPWIQNTDWWPLLTELPAQVRIRFAERGIDIPIPRREITADADLKTARRPGG
jgi:small conductance mechanosensitive channel